MQDEYLLDIESVDPETLDIGTELQDSALIAQMFERGAHSTYTESAVYATFSRTLVTSKTSGSAIKTSLYSYFRHPEESNSSDGIVAGNQEGLIGLSFGTTSVPVSMNDFGNTLLDYAKNCIPCVDRILALAELKPHIDFLGALEGVLKGRLKFLSELGNLLNN